MRFPGHEIELGHACVGLGTFREFLGPPVQVGLKGCSGIRHLEAPMRSCELPCKVLTKLFHWASIDKQLSCKVCVNHRGGSKGLRSRRKQRCTCPGNLHRIHAAILILEFLHCCFPHCLPLSFLDSFLFPRNPVQLREASSRPKSSKGRLKTTSSFFTIPPPSCGFFPELPLYQSMMLLHYLHVLVMARCFSPGYSSSPRHPIATGPSPSPERPASRVRWIELPVQDAAFECSYWYSTT